MRLAILHGTPRTHGQLVGSRVLPFLLFKRDGVSGRRNSAVGRGYGYLLDLSSSCVGHRLLSVLLSVPYPSTLSKWGGCQSPLNPPSRACGRPTIWHWRRIHIACATWRARRLDLPTFVDPDDRESEPRWSVSVLGLILSLFVLSSPFLYPRLPFLSCCRIFPPCTMPGLSS
ncbi:hypothetical protein SODALDRAFT_138892 [Sodiomyces alkalinus F11]|uniref:Uncharacterized protein n=1 Tax=Sodiomyces alkalinus (strain CBS 110278 / VKM F-3762 / F11) TaxID=1314773 RepID=A0A3N2PZG5_SODAK|nr:hypothetical protein SODALDRAFT_138892 [Sodiomyces alkalinus F11]ROT39826.1 hypothetical protein SODALDRAFT_138892 [Sodiomyces alkalinus F11]